MDTATAPSIPHAATMGAPPARSRLDAIDLLRGIIIVVMALDHVHDFFGVPGANPVDLATTTAPLFFTRWITHFCAPVFFLLTGTGAFLTLRRMSKGGLSRFLLTRGLWLIVLEAVVMRFALQFNVDYQVTLLIVLWALGWAMIVLAGLIYLPMAVLVAVGVAMVAGHNLLDGIAPAAFGALVPLWTVLHVPGFLVTGPHAVFVTYPLVPWLGAQIFSLETTGAKLNYGLNKVRFPSPLLVGKRIRGSAVFSAVTPVPAGLQVTISYTVEIEGEAKPACVAETLVLLLEQ